MKLDGNYFTTKWVSLKRHRAFQKHPILTLFRVISWLMYCQLSRSSVDIKIPKWNCRFLLPPKLKSAGSTGIFIFREYYEPELWVLDTYLTEGKVFIDAGANTGIYTIIAGKLVGNSGTVLSFEPGSESFQTLARNVEINQLSNVKLFQSALSEQEGYAKLYHIDNAPNSYSLGGDLNSQANFEEVHTTTIDNVLSREQIEQVDLIKMDVEGAEEYVLRGAISLFSRLKPIVIFEYNPHITSRFKSSPDGAWNFLKELGYEFFQVQPTGEGDLLKLDAPKVGNIVAISQANPQT